MEEKEVNISQETPPSDVFMPPSVHDAQLLAGESYSHFSAIPPQIAQDMSTKCVLGVDEAGRGPVIGPMVYGLLYLPLATQESLLTTTHHFNDSKVLTPSVRSSLMSLLCQPGSDLHSACGWATTVMSARDISAGMMKRGASYNLNAQAMDATVELIRRVLDMGVCVDEVYIDTIGQPGVYRAKLERVFPALRITVAKKADSLYPCVSAASVCAKVTRDAALERCWWEQRGGADDEGWGSGYPSDGRCSGWMRRTMDEFWGWGAQTRYSWATAKTMLEPDGSSAKGQIRVGWADEDDEDEENEMEGSRGMAYYLGGKRGGEGEELARWYGGGACVVDGGL